MPEPTTGPRRARTVTAVAAVAAAMAVLTACSGSRHSSATAGPVGVNASIIARLGDGTVVGQAVTAAATAPGTLSMSSGANGSLLMAAPGYVAEIGDRGTLAPAVSGTGSTAPRGVVGLPDGSLVTGQNGRLMRVTPGQTAAAIAGASGALRSLTAPVPASASATAVHFTRYLTPVGSIGDGSLILADGDAVWRMRVGKVTRIYRGSVLGRTYAVTPTGTLYLVPAGAGATLAKTVVVTPAGTPGTLKLPASIPGVSGAPGTLTPLSESSDGQDGIYVHAVRLGAGGTPTGDYVLHLTGGTATLTAASSAPGDARNCAVTGTTSPVKFPCPLPQALISQPGLLVLAGGTTYAVGVRMPMPGASASPTS